MKAIVQEGYGSPQVLRLREIDKPVAGDDDVLVHVHAAAVNAGDYFMMKGKPLPMRMMLGLFKPKSAQPGGQHVPGWDFAGRVETVGKNVTGLRPGDEVYGAGGVYSRGAFAEYVRVPADRLAPKPTNLTFEQAAAVPIAACTALRGLRDAGGLRPGQKVLINGASGGVGTFAVQIAKALGAEVTGVCSAGNVDLLRSIGADHVVDYTKEDFTRGTQRYDLILDNIGTHSFSAYRKVLTPQGIVIPNTGHAGMGYLLRASLLSARDRQVGRMFSGSLNSENLLTVKELTESGKLTPVIDRTYPLSETPAAMGYAARGHVRGKVVITV